MPKNKHDYIRIDFNQKIISIDEKTRVVHFVLKPDPRRYETFNKDGDTWYRDKYLDLKFGPKTIEQIVKQSLGMPINFSPPNIRSLHEYTLKRKKAIEDGQKTGENIEPEEKPDPHRPLQPSQQKKHMTFISIDIKNSTKLKHEYKEKYDKLLGIFVNELGIATGHFHGSILKFTGDGFILYLDEPFINSQCDNAIDLCLTIHTLTKNAINPFAQKIGMQNLDIRIGAEHGLAKIKMYNITSTGYKNP